MHNLYTSNTSSPMLGFLPGMGDDSHDNSYVDLPLEWDEVFDNSPSCEIHVDSISDALVMSLSNLARVDIEYISHITGRDHKAVISALKGSIYQNPETWDGCLHKGWETAEEYLSGNLMRKWNAVEDACCKYPGYFDDNRKALLKVLPHVVDSKDIYITLGSPWIPVEVIDEFISYILSLKRAPYHGTKHDSLTGTWELTDKGRYNNRIKSTHTYGTERMPALQILEKTLNMKSVTVFDTVPCPTSASGTKRVVNKTETVLALEKQQQLITKFRDWVWKDYRRSTELETIFENNFSCMRNRNFDGSFLEFPTMSPEIELYPYQKNAVARILFTPNTLLAHDVGSGKTYVMIAAGMELKRMGLSLKNLYVVPNNVIGQWKSIFTSMYPCANILCIEPKDFTKQKRRAVLESIRDNDFDGIIMACSCFEQIPLSKDYYIKEIEEASEKIRKITSDPKKSTTKLERKREALAKELARLTMAASTPDDNVYFDELGITRLFVDEAHNYKNVPLETKADKVLGLNPKGSSKCREMLDKVHYVQKQNDGGGVVLATGTPITNSITDVYVMQKYLQSGELAMLDLQSFDSWAGMFAERETLFEIDVDTSGYRLATRFSKFHNLPELTSLLASVADFHRVDRTNGIPDFDGYTDTLIPKTSNLADYLRDISERAEEVRAGFVNRTEDNMLKITTDGRKAALDLRLVKPELCFTYDSKVARCAENILDIYAKTSADRSTQLVFCDSSTPKNGFNIYDELERLLVKMGIPAEEIAFVHDADTESKRSKLFERVRSGEVRILMGSTFKLGLGVNVQDKLIALHHLDIPWRPADMTQREGRILRQGNKNSKVQIFRYITEGSFDAYSWQLLETKQRFISDLLSGSVTDRSGSDIEDTVLDYAEVKALAVGNPLIKERVELANELTRYMTLQHKAIETHISLEKELSELPETIVHQAEIVEKCRLDIKDYAACRREHTKDERSRIRSLIYEAVSDNVLMKEERPLLTYQGFRVMLPANMRAEKPYIWLKKNGRYFVELEDTAVGMLIRIDNFLEALPKHLTKLEEAHANLIARKASVKAEIEKKENYTDKIDKITRKIESIDKKLGVKKK